MNEQPAIRPLLLEGTPYRRGLTHGQALKGEIRELVQAWRADLAAALKLDADSIIGGFLQRTDFVPAIRQWTPDLLEEVRGIADGSGLAFETMLAFQLVDELWVNCTSIGFRAGRDEPAYVAQNIDVEMLRDGHQVVLHIRYQDTDLETFVVTCAGLIGFNGMNSRAVGLCCNGLMTLNSRPDGLPVACVVRGVLAQPSVAEAVTFLQRVPHACGQNYLVGGASQLVDLECSANQVRPYEPNGRDGALWHANLPLASDDYTPYYRKVLEAHEPNPMVENNEARFDNVARRLQGSPAIGRLPLIQEILASRDSAQHPICATKGADEFFAQIGIFSFAATIMELSAAPALHVTFTPAEPSSYTRLAFAGRGAQP